MIFTIRLKHLKYMRIGANSQFGRMEGFVTALIDEWPQKFRKRREVLIAAICFLSFLIGLIIITEVC